MPGRRPVPFLELWLVLLLGIGAGVLATCLPIGTFDESFVLVGGERVLSGELPFRDFYAIYPPGQYFVVAGLMGVFGRSILALRLYCVVVRALIALLFFIAARHLASRRLAWASWGATILWIGFCGKFVYPGFPAYLLLLLALTLAARQVDRLQVGESPSGIGGFLVGALLGATAFFRHDLAGYGALACLPLLLPLPRRSWLGCAAGMVCAFGLPMACLLAFVPLQEVIFEFFTNPFKIYPYVRSLPYPPLVPFVPSFAVLASPVRLLQWFSGFPMYVPLAIDLAGFAWLATLWRRGGRAALLQPRALRFLSLLLLGTFCFNLVRGRADLAHALPMIFPCFTIAAALVEGFRDFAPARRLAASGGIVLLAALTFPVALYNVFVALRVDLGSLASRAGATASPCRNPGGDYTAAAAYLRSVVPASGRIYVGCDRHDMLVANEPVLYYLAERLPAGMYHALDPGVATTLEAQRHIVSALDRDRVEYVVLSSRCSPGREPNQSSVSSGVTELDDYLRAHYRLDRRFGEFLAVWRRSDPWPP